jgi:hypothetical protein
MRREGLIRNGIELAAREIAGDALVELLGLESLDPGAKGGQLLRSKLCDGPFDLVHLRHASQHTTSWIGSTGSTSRPTAATALCGTLASNDQEMMSRSAASIIAERVKP